MLLAGGVLIVVGAALGWSGVSYSSRLDRKIALAAGIAALLLAGVGFRTRRWPFIGGAIPGLLALDMAVVNIHDVAGHGYEYAAFPDARVGIGLYTLGVGAVLELLTSGITLLPGIVRGLNARASRESR